MQSQQKERRREGDGAVRKHGMQGCVSGHAYAMRAHVSGTVVKWLVVGVGVGVWGISKIGGECAKTRARNEGGRDEQ